jgi:hypothetical protein
MSERYPWALVEQRWPDESLLEEQDRRLMHFMAPRALWADGPWDEEPDLIRWKHEPTGYELMMWRNHMGAWCGYVGLPPEHPLHGLHYGTPEFLERLESHHGLTFSDTFEEVKDRLELPDELRKLWWLGFDCAHFGDVMPAMEAFTDAWRVTSPGLQKLEAMKKRLEEASPEFRDRYRESYKGVDEVRLMVEDLAGQCAYAATVAKGVERLMGRIEAPDEEKQTEGHDEGRTREH